MRSGCHHSPQSGVDDTIIAVQQPEVTDAVEEILRLVGNRQLLVVVKVTRDPVVAEQREVLIGWLGGPAAIARLRARDEHQRLATQQEILYTVFVSLFHQLKFYN